MLARAATTPRLLVRLIMADLIEYKRLEKGRVCSPAGAPAEEDASGSVAASTVHTLLQCADYGNVKQYELEIRIAAACRYPPVSTPRLHPSTPQARLADC